jgi:hypothetical protein
MEEVDFVDIEGKRVKKVFGDDYDEEILIVFDDDTFCHIEAAYSDEDSYLLSGNFSYRSWGNLKGALLELGVISQEQYDTLTNTKVKMEQMTEAEERRQYEILKAKFEPQE